MSRFARKYVFLFSILCPGSLTLFVKTNAVKSYCRSTVLYWWKLLSKDAPQISMSYILVQDIFDKLHWSLPLCPISFTLSINFYSKFIDATMLSDEAPFSIVNVACHGCQDEMRSTGDTHELETRQLVLCISVSTTFPIVFVWMLMTGY